ncbi:hypothetical protein [Prevotella sp. oral taxon 299]|uniref:hypothetical protein n=1 Tax=Prevotella sp. oral taxon 299 TaxID=652716 RepID=UPI0012EC0BB6|nr:hypothetical protein [Prevotella sp. oral taxon 299]
MNRKQLLLYAHRSEPKSRAISIPTKNQSFSHLFRNTVLLASNLTAFTLQYHCVYTPKAMLLSS